METCGVAMENKSKSDGRFKPGNKASPGRTKGVPNKITQDIKAMVLQALENKGGAAWLETQFDENPVAVMALLGKILPTQITGPEGTSGKLVVRWES